MQLCCLLSCEHSSNRIPREYAALFAGGEQDLRSHRGWDKGSLLLYKAFVRLGIFQHHQYATTSRLLVDLNRSLSSRNLFSSYTRTLPVERKRELIDRYYLPYRNKMREVVEQKLLTNQQVLHLSLHSFTPVFKGEIRNGDIGVLYDPGHGQEQSFARIWIGELRKLLPDLVIRANYPYRGKADGHPTPFRKRCGSRYIGVEFELNQRLAQELELHRSIALSFQSAVHSFAPKRD